MNTKYSPVYFLTCAWVLSMGTSPLLKPQQQQTDSRVLEEKVGDIAVGTPQENVIAAASNNGQKIAWASKISEKEWIVVVNGEAQGATYKTIGPMAFSPDGKRLVYGAASEKGPVVIVDGQEQELELVQIASPVFSSDGRRLAYWKVKAQIEKSSNGSIKRTSYYCMVLDGEEGPVFSHTVSADPGLSGALADALVGLIFPPGNIYLPPGIFSQDNQRFAYYVFNKDIYSKIIRRPVLENQVQDFGEQGVSPIFSPNSQHFAYSAKRGEKDWVVVIDGQPGNKYEAILCGPAYSQDGQIALVVEENKKIVELVGDQRIRVIDSISGFNWGSCLSISPDRKRLAYLLGDDKWFKESRKRQRIRVVVDGQAGKEYKAENISAPLFSPDALHIAYVVQRADIKRKQTIMENKSLVVLDGNEGKLYWQIFDNTLRFTPENTLTYIGRRGGQFYRITQKLPPSN